MNFVMVFGESLGVTELYVSSPIFPDDHYSRRLEKLCETGPVLIIGDAGAIPAHSIILHIAPLPVRTGLLKGPVFYSPEQCERTF